MSNRITGIFFFVWVEEVIVREQPGAVYSPESSILELQAKVQYNAAGSPYPL
jgi:hypothetical protein